MIEIILPFAGIVTGIDALIHCRGVILWCCRATWRGICWVAGAYMSAYLDSIVYREGWASDMYGHVWRTDDDYSSDPRDPHLPVAA